MPDSTTTLHEIKISELPVATAANATDQLEANQAGTSRSITVGQIGGALSSSGGAGGALSVATSVANLAALKALATRPQTVLIQGYNTANDGGAGPPWVWAAGSTATADDFMVVSPAGTPAGRYIRQFQAGANVSPKWAGCGLGAADDSVQFQKVVNFGAAVDCSGGTYPLSTINITVSTTCPGIFSDGSGTIMAAPGTTLSTSIFVVTKSDFYIDRLFFNLPTSTSPTVSAALSTGIRFSGTGTRARVTNCRIIGGSANMTLQGSWSDVFILNNVCEQSWGDAISAAVGGNVTISGNLVKDGGYSTSQTSGGIRVGYTAADPTPENIVIRDNIIRNFAVFGQSSIDCYQPTARNILITSNVCDLNGSGIELKTDNTVLTDNVYQNVIISNNLIRMLNLGATGSSGVAFNSTVNGLPDTKPGKVLVTGNFISLDTQALTTDPIFGITGVTAYANTEVSNNFILNTRTGINFSASATTVGAAWAGLVVTANNVNCSGPGIYLGSATGTLTSPRVTNNIVVAGQQGLIFNVATINGATVTGNYATSSGGFAFDIRDAHDTLIKNNVFTSTSTSTISLSGTASTNIIIDSNDLTSTAGNALNAATGTGIVVSNNKITTPAASGTIVGAATYLTANNTRGTVTASPTGTYAGSVGDVFYNGTPASGGLDRWLCITAGTSGTAVWQAMPGFVNGASIQIANGAVATPSLSFTGAPLSGLYNSAGNAVAIATNAKPAFVLNESGTAGNYVRLYSNNGPTVVGDGPTNPNLTLAAGTGNGGVDIKGNNTLCFLMRFISQGATTANYLQVQANNAGTGPQISSQGSDTDIDINLQPKGAGLLKFLTASSIVANGSVAVTMTALGPTGANTTIREWLAIKNSAGATRYIPLY
jgi:Right handed beta helix region